MTWGFAFALVALTFAGTLALVVLAVVSAVVWLHRKILRSR